MNKDETQTIEICIPNREASSQMTAELAKTLQSLESPDVEEDYRVCINFSYQQPIDANRNKMVKDFLDKPNAKWLLMIDNDVVPPTNILDMVKFDKPVVSAVVIIKKGKSPTPLMLKENGTKYRQMEFEEVKDKIDEETGLIPVEGVGTGCLLIRRDVLEEKIAPPWFKFQYNEWGGLQLGEDLYFSRQLQKNDIDPYVATDYICSHFKKVDFLEILEALKEDGDDDE